ncbi:MAG: hypothetical protein ACI87E_000254 [Mariniblastus sp.]|jgi:hypothetical protein
MWRTLLLGKLTISILASLAVGGLCLAHPYQTELGFAAATRWTGLGVFFLLLSVAQVLAVVLLFRKKSA